MISNGLIHSIAKTIDKKYLCLRGVGHLINSIFFAAIISYLSDLDILRDFATGIPILEGIVKNLEKLINNSNLLLYFTLPLLVLSIYIFFRFFQNKWYLTTDYLNRRSFISAITIIFLTTLVCEIICKKRNLGVFFILFSWNNVPVMFRAKSLALAALSIGFSLFSTSLMISLKLPGFPSSGFIEFLSDMRSKIKSLRDNKIWMEYLPDSNELNQIVSLSRKIEKELNENVIWLENLFVKEILTLIRDNIPSLITVLQGIKGLPTENEKKNRWERYFSSANIQLPDKEAELRLSIQKLKEIVLDK